MNPTRRRFLAATAAAGALRLGAQSPESRIDVLVNEPIGTIAPEIYGHFVEHLGGVVYDGIWVGENSRIPNVNGLRKSLIDALVRIKPGMIRWPGGCFADQYDWRDGTGPRDRRPKRTNFWNDAPEWPANARKDGPERFDPNSFGTVEFSRFCKSVGAAPYFAANLRSLPAQEFWRWVEYCNSPANSTTLAALRAADGEPQPLNVRYWGVGNESWGCGGNFDPEDYGSEFNRYTAWVPSYGVRPVLLGSGPNGGNVDWTRRFFSKLAKAGTLGRLSGWAMHHYAWNASAGRTQDWYSGKRDAVKFDTEQYYEILAEADKMEGLITAHWSVMAESDPRHRTKLVVDEWGSWYSSGTEPFPEALIGQQNTLRDAVLAGLTLDTFHRHADKISMAAIAQLVNCLQSLFLAHEDKFCLTPTYHVFDMYAAHQGARALRTLVASPSNSYSRNGSPAAMRGLNGSASAIGNQLTLTVTNPSMDQTREAEIQLHGASPKSVAGIVLAAPDPRAHNTFEAPGTVQPKSVTVALKGSAIVHQFPPASVTKLTITL